MRYLILLVVILSIPALAFSDTIIVPDDYPTIQGAIDAAVNGDTVLVMPGNYHENIDFKGKTITVKSSEGYKNTDIMGPHNGSVVTFANGEGSDSVLDGFTIVGGSGTYYQFYPPFEGYFCGGGIYCNYDSSPTIMNNRIGFNFADFGGGVFCNDESCPLLINNDIRSNNASDSGGGIYCYHSSPTITDNTIRWNIAMFYGGGITCYQSSPTITGNAILENNANGQGGGLYCDENPAPTVTGNLIADNMAGVGGGIRCYESFAILKDNTISANIAKWGGGICCTITDSTTMITGNLITDNVALEGGGYYGFKSSTTLIDNTIFKNVAGDDGGGIYYIHCDDPSPTLINNTICENIGYRGGGIFCSDSYPMLANNTIVKNLALDQGGGIYSERDSNLTIVNTILWDNDAYELWIGDTNYPSTLTISYSDVEGSLSSVHVESGCTLNWGSGMIDSVPLFVDESNGDFHLIYNSPCRGSGDNSVVTELFDFEGDPRIAYGTVDMGADEFYTHLYVTGNKTPGGAIQGKFVGLPGTTPVGLFVGSGVLPSPLSTMWGEFWLQTPWFLFTLVPISSNGILELPTTLPGTIPAPYDIPMQALIGLNADSLTNLCVLNVK